MSWASATSPISSTTGPSAAAAAPNAVETVPSIPLAPRLESTRGASLADGEERLDVADRHRGGDEQRRVGRQPLAQARGDQRLGQLVAERRVDRARRRRRRRRASARASPGRRRMLAGVSVEQRAGSPRRACPTTASGSCQAPLGIERDLRRRPPAPASQARSGLEVGRSPTRITNSGRCAVGEARVAQQQVVVGDRGRSAARAGQRVGEQRDAARARRSRPARARRRRSRSAPGDDHARGRTGGGPGRGRSAGRRRRHATHGRPPSRAAVVVGQRLRRARAARAAGSSGAPGPGGPSSAVQ